MDQFISLILLLLVLLALFFAIHYLMLQYSKEKFRRMNAIPLCPRCGSSNMQMAGLFLGPFGPAKHRCAECNYEGILIEVEKDKVADFRKKLKKK